jgi:hypothetical protein
MKLKYPESNKVFVTNLKVSRKNAQRESRFFVRG